MTARVDKRCLEKCGGNVERLHGGKVEKMVLIRMWKGGKVEKYKRVEKISKR